MRSILFFDSYHTGLNGAPTSMLSLAVGLKIKGYSVSVGSSSEGGLLKKATDSRLDTISINAPKILLLSRKQISFYRRFIYFFSLLLLWFKLLLLKRQQFSCHDFICINDIRSVLLLLPLLLIYKRKVIWYVRINERVKFVSSIAAFLSEKIVLISSDCSNVLSCNEKKRYQSKLIVLNTGFKFSELNELVRKDIVQSLPRGSNRVYITVGSICKRKNQRDIIHAFGKCSSDNDLLFLIGSPTSEEDVGYQNELIHLIDELGISGNVIRVPHTPYVHEYLSVSDIFMFSSHREGLPRVVIEALHAGCFVCSSLVDGITDIICDKSKGLITNKKSQHPDFFDEFISIVSAVDDKDLEQRAERSKYVSRRFDYDMFIKGFIEVLESINRGGHGIEKRG